MSNPIRLDDEPSYSLRRQYVDEYLRRELAALPASTRLLDLGGVRAGQRGQTDPSARFAHVLAANIVRDKSPDLQADAAALPLAAGSQEAVLCSEVLEHVRDPRQVLAQVWRVLAPGGCLLITVPFLFRQHGDPSDYGRYTEWYWQETLGELGFEQIEIEKQGLFASVLADMLRHRAQQNLMGGGRLYPLRRWLLPRAVRWLRLWARRADGTAAGREWGAYAGGFGIRAVKGGGA